MFKSQMMRPQQTGLTVKFKYLYQARRKQQQNISMKLIQEMNQVDTYLSRYRSKIGIGT